MRGACPPSIVSSRVLTEDPVKIAFEIDAIKKQLIDGWVLLTD